MFTRAEKGYLALTLCFLAAGSGIKAYRHASVKLGPFPGPAFAGSRAGAAKADSVPANPDFFPADSTGHAAVAEGTPGNDSLSIALRDGPAGVNETSRGGSQGGSGEAGTGESAGRGSASGAGKSAFAGKVDLNRAEVGELTHVKGIGEKTAQAIVEYRRAHGPFRKMRDLLRVKGIGEKKLEKLTPFLIL